MVMFNFLWPDGDHDDDNVAHFSKLKYILAMVMFNFLRPHGDDEDDDVATWR